MSSSLGKIILLDDEKNILLVLEAMLERSGFEARLFDDSEACIGFLETMESGEAHAIITDLYMPGPSGMDVLAAAQKFQPGLSVVMLTAFGTVESAVAALKKGAFDYITKPFDQDELIHVMKKAVATTEQRTKEPVYLSTLTPDSGQAPGMLSQLSMVGSSRSMQEVFRVISKIADSPSTVLIRGESGTGKELVAYAIHQDSSRVNKPFIKINCAAIPSTLIESELFGYERGAFTGAVTSKPGRFELAHEGTLFLDEVAEMPLEMQVKLLRVLQEHEFQRVGGVSTVKVDVRIITATNKNLEEEITKGRFREDLFYRLNVVPIFLPALRERREDIDPLIHTFIQDFNAKLKREIRGVSPETLRVLRHYPWPGNIRQLENALERMILMSDSPFLAIKDLPEEIRDWSTERGMNLELGDEEDVTLKEIVRKQTQTLERDLIERALEETKGNVTRAADKLGLSRKGLQLKMKELGLKRSAH